jgi:hypothetical protein
MGAMARGKMEVMMKFQRQPASPLTPSRCLDAAACKRPAVRVPKLIAD